MTNIRQKLFSILTVFATSFFIVSCGSDDTVVVDLPSLSVTAAIVDGASLSDGGDVVATESVQFTINVTAPGGFNTLLITGGTDDQIDRNDLNIDAGTTSVEISLTASTTAADEGAIATFNFVAVDEGGQESAQSSFTFNIVSPAVNTYSTVLLGAQGNAAEGFYNAIDNIRYSYADARDASTVTSSPADFAYYWGTTNNSTIAAINDSGLDAVYSAVNLPIDGIFGTKNATTFVSSDATAAEFDAIADNEALLTEALFETGGTSSATELANSDVIAFRLDAARGGEFGLIKIESVDDTNGTGTITIVVKVPGDYPNP
jgi:hypothetical protein